MYICCSKPRPLRGHQTIMYENHHTPPATYIYPHPLSGRKIYFPVPTPARKIHSGGVHPGRRFSGNKVSARPSHSDGEHFGNRIGRKSPARGFRGPLAPDKKTWNMGTFGNKIFYRLAINYLHFVPPQNFQKTGNPLEQKPNILFLNCSKPYIECNLKRTKTQVPILGI
jgi:hypothetical protein